MTRTKRTEVHLAGWGTQDGWRVLATPGLAIVNLGESRGGLRIKKLTWSIVHEDTGLLVDPLLRAYEKKEDALSGAEQLATLADWTQPHDVILDDLDVTELMWILGHHQSTLDEELVPAEKPQPIKLTTTEQLEHSRFLRQVSLVARLLDAEVVA